MIIKSFKLFESNSENNFPDLEEIKSYLYDFTDESDTFVDDYEFGYIIFDGRKEFIDILKTNTCFWFIYLIGTGNICMLVFKIN